MPNEKNNKFTAAMTFNVDKVTIQELRDKCNLGEKEMMRIILKVVLNHEPELLDAADEFIAAELAAVAAAKAQQAAAKAAAKAQKEAAKAAELADKVNVDAPTAEPELVAA